jgi:hypothetical protein
MDPLPLFMNKPLEKYQYVNAASNKTVKIQQEKDMLYSSCFFFYSLGRGLV